MPRPFPMILLAAISLFLAACGPTQTATPINEAPLAGARIGGPFELTGEDGKTYRWSDFDGEYRIVYFGYTYCPDVCPTDMQRTMAGLKKFAKAQPQLAENIQPIFVTVDPERDTPAVLTEFTDAFHPRLLGLTGSPEKIEEVAKKFAVAYSKGQEQPGGGYLMNHQSFVYLFGPKGEPIATLPADQGADAVAAELTRWVR
ncbi:SCO family protein [Erythrobacter sp. 3-20A1M]|nr:SCO family protein [Erythrobacter sp. 3-20A1M]